MALQWERPSRAVRRRQLASWSSIFSAMVLLFVVVAAAEESLSRKQLQWPEKEGEEVHPKNLHTDHGGSIWKVLISQVVRISGSSGNSPWPEVKLGVRTISAIILGALAAAVCSASGLGGGLLFVPLLKVLLQFDSKTATAISNFMILGSASVGVAINLIRDHPAEFNKPLVDFDIALLLQPNMLLGISVGVILNGALPNWLITAVLMVMLVYVAYRTTRSGITRWRNETRVAAEKRNRKKKTLRRSTTQTEKALTESLLGFYNSISSRYPVMTILALLLVWLALFAVQLLRIGHGTQFDVPDCGVSYWLLTASQVPITLGVTAWVMYKQRAAAAAAPEPGTSDIQDQAYPLGSKESAYFSGMALVAGVLAGMLGIGGALIINPLLLSVGILPQVAAATSLLLVFFSSSMSSFEYWLMGRVPTGFALIAALICAMSSAVGVLGLQKMVNKYGRPSFIVFTVAGVMGLSFILVSIIGTQDAWNQYQSGADMGFSYPCLHFC